MIKIGTHITSTPIDILPNWHTVEMFTGDEMIDAYFLGKQAGIQAGWNENFKILVSQFTKNIESAIKISEELNNEIFENGYTLKAILLKSEGLTKFTALYITEFEDYISEDFLKVFRIVRKYRGSVKNEDIYISFLFMPYSDHIDHDCLTADGYFLRYDKSK